jgi:lipopolysaccharide export system ATP-binding protein
VFAAWHLVKKYVDHPGIHDVSLFVRRAEVVALLGPVGAGKSTFFRLLMGLSRLDAGQIVLDDHDITDAPAYERARRGLSFLPQEPSVFHRLTVEQNLVLALEALEFDPAYRRELVDALLEIFGLTKVRRVRSGQLSGGERRRCEIARVMALRPKYVLLDEPFVGLDPLGIGNMRVTISLLAEHGIGVLITDHNVRATLSLVDRAYIIENGRILAHGTPDLIISDQRVRGAYLGDTFSPYEHEALVGGRIERKAREGQSWQYERASSSPTLTIKGFA